MCKKLQFEYCPSRIDKCMVECINTLNSMSHKSHIKPVGCCCGHGKYSMSIIVKNSEGHCWELLSGISIPRKKRFYKKDKTGYYYIPELLENKKNV